MRTILQKRALRFVLLANVISMPGSGMNSAAVAWHILHATYGAMGSARGVSGVAMNTSLMESVPKHCMGGVQNTFSFVGTFLQITLALVVGSVAQKMSRAGGFAIIGSVYVFAFGSAVWPVPTVSPVASDGAGSSSTPSRMLRSLVAQRSRLAASS